jgi:tetratricopeptide (TPR) repeat protein
VPATVTDVVLARLALLPGPVAGLVRQLAVVPTRVERGLAERLADDPSDVEAAERSGMVSGDLEHLAFRHELARRAVEGALTAGERRRANRRVVESLLDQAPATPARIVHHAERAGLVDVLIRHGPAAAAEAARGGAHRQAAETLRLVLEHAGSLGSEERATLLTRRAYSLYVVNRYDEALGCAESAVEAAETEDHPLVLGDALVVLARVALFGRGPLLARGPAARAVELLEPTGDRARLAVALTELARAHSNLATVGIVAEPTAEGVAYAERALQLAEQLSRADLRAHALCYLGSNRLAGGDPRGHEDLRRAVQELPDTSPLEIRVRTYVNAAGSAFRSGRPDRALELVHRGLQLAADGSSRPGSTGFG